MGDRKPYPSDVTDAQWALIGPFLHAWRSRRVSVAGRHDEQDLREVVNAILYQNRTGCQWAYLPHDLPQKPVTYYYFGLWRDDGTDVTIHDLLRCQTREKAGRAEDPSAVAVDTQSIRAANHVPAATTGKDAGKKVPGRKRGLAVDALGLIIAVVVTAASVTDNAIGIRLLDKVAEHTPTVTHAWVDAGFKQDLAVHAAVLGIDVEVVKRSDSKPGFVPVKKRWIVEQVYGTLMLHRRLSASTRAGPSHRCRAPCGRRWRT
jgi:transposase